MNENTEEFDQTAALKASAPYEIQGEAGSARRPTACAGCSAPLVAKIIGRPRVTCSDGCRRRLDRVMRKVRRREAWINEWRASARRGEVTEAAVRREVREIEADIRTFISELRPAAAE